MGVIPRRHRSLVYKLLVLVPLLWLTVALIMYNDSGGAGKSNSSLQQQGEAENEIPGEHLYSTFG